MRGLNLCQVKYRIDAGVSRPDEIVELVALYVELGVGRPSQQPSYPSLCCGLFGGQRNGDMDNVK